MIKNYIAILVAVLLGAAQLGLIAAKLLGRIQWSWTWVMTPLWLPIVVVVVIAIIAVALFSGAQSRGENPFQ